MKKLFNIQSVQSAVSDSLEILKSYDISVETWDTILIHKVSSKISDDTLRAWEDSLTDREELPTWKEMDDFLSKRIEQLETILDFRKPNSRVTMVLNLSRFTSNQKLKEIQTFAKNANIIIC